MWIKDGNYEQTYNETKEEWVYMKFLSKIKEKDYF